jgi:hypothetical protein
MTTAPTTTAAPANTSLLSKLETDIVSVGTKLKAGIEAAGTDAVKMAAWVQENSPEITALAALAGPGGSTVTSLGLSLFTAVSNAVKDAGDSASKDGLSVSLDAALIAQVKAIIAAIEKI